MPPCVRACDRRNCNYDPHLSPTAPRQSREYAFQVKQRFLCSLHPTSRPRTLNFSSLILTTTFRFSFAQLAHSRRARTLLHVISRLAARRCPFTSSMRDKYFSIQRGSSVIRSSSSPTIFKHFTRRRRRRRLSPAASRNARKRP